ncbi:hypothetical protein QAD02_010738 [Eretmocerus hayati]|uniref:Uncharacterized protein n=1 Tax=Eretmocerus hayati TaxID=131215 RepID=A0ACC2NXM2_9HYME|nr:hypothetical protein QAD02_010738 [Eretmocerus hayati]
MECVIMTGDLDSISTFLRENTVQFHQWEDYIILLEVLRKGDYKTAKLLVEYGFRVNYEQWFFHSTTPLHLAVKSECVDLVETMLEKGARLDICDEEYQNPVFIAGFILQNDALIDLLLEKVPLKKFVCDDECVTGYLHVACMRNRVDIVKKLLQNEADINAPSDLESVAYYGYTPLHFAVKFGCKETVEFLVDCDVGIFRDRLHDCGFTPLHLAFELGYTDMVDIFLQCCILEESRIDNPVDRNKLSHFHIACARNNVEVVKKFLNVLKVDVNTGMADSKSQNQHALYEKSPLQMAIAHGCKDVAQLLLKHNAIINDDITKAAKIAFGLELSELISSKTVDYVKADLNNRQPRYESLSAFHSICYNNSIAGAKKFVASHKVDVNHRVDPDSAYYPGFTPLHFVVKSRHFCANCEDENKIPSDEVPKKRLVSVRILPPRDLQQTKKIEDECLIGYLIQLGADITLKNGLGISALELAVQEITTNVIPDMGIHCFLRAAPEKTMQFFNLKGITQFHILCAHRTTDIESLESAFKPEILDQPVSSDFPMIGGYTPLHLAAVSGSSKTLIWLLDHGANPALLTPDDESTLHLIIDRYNEVGDGSSTLETNLIENSSVLCRLILSSNPISRISGKSQFHLICEILSPQEIKFALKNKIANVNARVNSHSLLISQGDTALHFALRRLEEEDDQFARWLLEYGVDVNVEGEGGNYPLHIAADDDVHYHWYKMLVTPFVINKVNDKGRTPLHELCKQNFLFNDDYYEAHLEDTGKLWYLLTHGADINICDKKGRTPFSLKLSKGTDDHSSFVTLAKHCRKLSLIGFHISNKNKSCYQKCKNFLSSKEYDEFKFTKICESEKLRMKNTVVINNLNLYDIIFYDEYAMEKVVRNELFEKYARSPQLQSKFPNYGYLIELQYEKGLRRKVMAERYRSIVCLMIGCQLPSECWDNIISHLTTEDMLALIDA